MIGVDPNHVPDQQESHGWQIRFDHGIASETIQLLCTVLSDPTSLLQALLFDLWQSRINRRSDESGRCRGCGFAAERCCESFQFTGCLLKPLFPTPAAQLMQFEFQILQQRFAPFHKLPMPSCSGSILRLLCGSDIGQRA